jgi:hypothetical protein
MRIKLSICCFLVTIMQYKIFIQTDNQILLNVTQLKYLWTTVRDKYLIQEEIQRRLKCCHSVQNLLSFRLLSKDGRIRLYNIIILLSVLYLCETWSLTLREEHDWGCLRTGCCRAYLTRREMECQEVRKTFIMRSFITYTLRHYN